MKNNQKNIESKKVGCPRVGVVVLIFNDDKEILLGRRLVANGYGDWAPPGGHLEYGETPEQCAIREVFEETGLKIDHPKFIALTNDIFADTKNHYMSVLMKVSFPEGQRIENIEPDKSKEWQWISYNNLPEKLFLPIKNLKNGSAYFGVTSVI